MSPRTMILVFLALFVSFVASMNARVSRPTMRSFSRSEVLAPFHLGKALKIISGLNNYDIDLVKNVAYAASHGGASHVDIACRADLVQAAKTSVAGHIPVCVSGIVPSDFVLAVDAGADMIEIGNFDSFYEKGESFGAEAIVSMTRETRRLLPDTVLSVTVPHTLSLHEQISLAKLLESCGVDIIQTEGKVISSKSTRQGVQELMEAAVPSLSSAYALSRAVSIPVMCASGLTDVTASLALSVGAKGVGIGSMVNKLKHPQQMLMAVSAIASAMGRDTSYYAESGSVDGALIKNIKTSSRGRQIA